MDIVECVTVEIQYPVKLAYVDCAKLWRTRFLR
jgi:hypothetical protein